MQTSKNDVFDYLDWRGDLSFQQSPLNEVDALIFSILSYLDFFGYPENEVVLLPKAVERLNALPEERRYDGPMFIHSAVLLANCAALSQRFATVGLTGFRNIIDEQRQMQFAALTFLLPDGSAVITFRGTDNTLVGWKEDFNMSFINGVPAQLEAAAYAQEMAERLNCPITITGHSKGGNLAVWAATKLTAENKMLVTAVYSNDGPGFSGDFLQTSEYAAVRQRVHSFVPEASIVGVLMNHDDYTTIASSSPSLLQHNPMSWLLLGTHFIVREERSRAGRQLENSINNWISSMSRQEREEFVEHLYGIITATGAKTLGEIDLAKLPPHLIKLIK